MAHVVLHSGGSRRELFLVDQAVGRGAPNKTDDVFLVQFFLRVASQPGGGKTGFQPPGEDPLVIDGIFGNHTQTYISFYQQEVNRREGTKLVETDGRIDPIVPGQLKGAITGTFYTILSLNAAYRTRRGNGTKIETDPLFPAVLSPSFFV